MPRRGRRAATVVAFASLLGAFGAQSAAAVPAPPFPEYYGISPATMLDRDEMRLVGGSGAGTLRLPLYWPSIEPNPPVQDDGDVLPLPNPSPPPESKRFDEIDALVAAAAENGVRVLPFVYGTPEWISSDPARPPLDSEGARAAWQDLLRDLVRRYGPNGELWTENPDLPETPIVDWQIGNEPNSQLYWHPAPSPAEYADLVALASDAIRAVDPGAAVVLAGMFGTPRNGIEAWTFMDGVYQVPGAAEAFDAHALHPYSPNLKGIKAQIDLIRDVLRRHGDKRLPLLITEIGWPTEGPATYNMVKTQRAQKALLAKAFRLFLAERRRWKVKRVVWYTWRDNDVQPSCAVCRYSGLFTANLEPKPAWRKFTQFAGGHP